MFDEHTDQHREGSPSTSRDDTDSGTRWGASTVVLCAFLAIAAFFLWTEHRAHLLGALPYLLILACPLLHLFMHRGHGHDDHGHGGGTAGRADGSTRSP